MAVGPRLIIWVGGVNSDRIEGGTAVVSIFYNFIKFYYFPFFVAFSQRVLILRYNIPMLRNNSFEEKIANL